MKKRNLFTLVFMLSFFEVYGEQKIKDLKTKKVQNRAERTGEFKRNLNLEKTKGLSSSKQVFEKIPSEKDLVEKLENLNQSLPKSYPGKNALTLRLAHILSRLAEENFKKAEEQGCHVCFKSAQKYAKRALEFYKKLDSVLQKSNLNRLHAEAVFQKAWLERILGNTNSSLFQFKRFLKKNKNFASNFWALKAWYNIGELQFESYNYDEALQAFQFVLKDSKKDICFKQSPSSLENVKKKSLFLNKNLSPLERTFCSTQKISILFRASYYEIWSLFNLGFQDQALNKMLSLMSSDLYTHLTLDKESQNLKNKLETEMLTIYSYASLTDQNLKFFYNFSKRDSLQNTLVKRKQRLLLLANRLKQIGRFKQSYQVWKAYLFHTNSFLDHLLAYSSMLDIDLILNYKNKLNVVGLKIEKILNLLSKLSKDEKSSINKQAINFKIKKFFYQMDKSRDTFNLKQREYLLRLYQSYGIQNPKETDVKLLTVFLLEDLKKYKEAGNLLQKVISISEEGKEVLTAELKEKFCVKQINLAQLSKDKKSKLKAYQFYIQYGQNNSLKAQLKYKLAYLYYVNKDFKNSQKAFLELALEKKESQNSSLKEISLKSAHLFLSSLKEQGNREEDLIAFSSLFKDKFSKNKKEFIKIYNLGILNYIEKLLQGKDFSRRPFKVSQNSQILKAWNLLNSFDVKSANQKELEIYYLNRLLLGKELLMLEEVNQSVKFLLASSNKTNKEIALTWQMWLSELRFDFKQVLASLKRLNFKQESEKHLLRLAHLSELAEQNPIFHYQNFLNKFPKSSFAKETLLSLLELSERDKKKDFLKQYAFVFKENLQELLYWILEIDQGEMDEDFMSFFIENKFMTEESFLGILLKRKEIISSFQKEIFLVQSHFLSKDLSEIQLNKKIKKYMTALNQLEEKATPFLQTQDWLIQVFVMSHLNKELKRFYDSVLNLPLSKELTPEERDQYKKILLEQMKVYLDKSNQLEKRLHILLSPDVLVEYQKSLENPVFDLYLKWEFHKLLSVLKGKHQKQVQNFIKVIENRQKEDLNLSVKNLKYKIEKIHEKLKLNPFDRVQLNLLLELEKQRKNRVKVSYLRERIKKLNQKQEKIEL
ncbi:MAG: hypothetical protein GDA46_03155 [Bdellovibrionales bacterium]|nr:hypothetical protein [Bdellovibrionales bacterium]